LNRVEPGLNFKNYFQDKNLIQYNGKKILIIDETTSYKPASEKLSLDLLVISGNPKLYFKKLTETFSVKQAVFDGSIPSWKIKYWKNDCDSLRIPYHDVNEKGAFVMKLN
jgi:competence protein ComEC